MQKLLEIKDPQALMGGLFPDLAPNQPALWRTGSNVLFADGKVEKHQGYTAEGATPTAIRAVEQGYAEGIRRIYNATAPAIYKEEYGVQMRIGNGFSGNGYWSITPFGNWLLATNDFDPPQIWKNTGADSMVPLATVRRPRFRLIKKFKEHIFGFYAQAYDFSSASDPEVWVPTPENSAGGKFIRDMDSDIFAAQPLGAGYAVYSADSMAILDYLGPPLYFGDRFAINGIGAVSDSGIIPVGSQHYGLSRKGFFVTDGVGFEYIDGPAVNRLLQTSIDWDEARRVVGLHNEKKTTVEWWFPKLDGTIMGLAYNYKARAWSISDLQITAATEEQVFEAPIVAAGTTWGLLGKSVNAGAAPLESSLRTFNLDCGAREQYKQWDMMRADIERIGVLEVRFGFSDRPDEAPQFDAWRPLGYDNWIHREAVHLCVEFRSTAADVDWKLGGLSFHGELTGYL